MMKVTATKNKRFVYGGGYLFCVHLAECGRLREEAGGLVALALYNSAASLEPILSSLFPHIYMPCWKCDPVRFEYKPNEGG